MHHICRSLNVRLKSSHLLILIFEAHPSVYVRKDMVKLKLIRFVFFWDQILRPQEYS